MIDIHISLNFSTEFNDKESGESASEMVQEEIPVHPRKRKLRAKTEAQSRDPDVQTRDVVLEKPPNPYKMYLNLRQQVRNFEFKCFYEFYFSLMFPS